MSANDNFHRYLQGVAKLGTCIPTQDPDTLEKQHLEVSQLIDFFNDDANAAIRGSSDAGVIYLYGKQADVGSVRFIMVDDMAHIEKQTSPGVWEHASFMTGSASVWIGESVALSAVGHILASEEASGQFGLLPHSHLNSITGLTENDTHVPFAYAAFPELAFQPDDVLEWIGKTHSFTMASPEDILVKSLTYKTGDTPAGSVIRIRYYEGTDTSGKKIFDQYFPASLFTANSTVVCVYNGILEFDKDQDYHVTYDSDSDFSLMMEATGIYPYMTGDAMYVREDVLLQTPDGDLEGHFWTSGDYCIYDRKIYICQTSGAQTGGFVANAALWKLVNANDTYYWDDEGTTLKNLPGFDTFIFNDGTRDRLKTNPTTSSLVSADGIQSLNLITDQANITAEGKIRLTIADTYSSIHDAVGYNGLLKLQLNGMSFHDGTNDRLKIDTTKTKIISELGPTGSYIQLDTDEITLHDSTKTRMFLGDDYTVIHDEPIQGGGYLTLQNKGLSFVDGTIARFYVDATNTILQAPDGGNNIDVTNDEINISDGTQTRVRTTSGSTILYGSTSQIRFQAGGTGGGGPTLLWSADGQYGIRIDSSGIDFTSNGGSAWTNQFT